MCCVVAAADDAQTVRGGGAAGTQAVRHRGLRQPAEAEHGGPPGPALAHVELGRTHERQTRTRWLCLLQRSGAAAAAHTN